MIEVEADGVPSSIPNTGTWFAQPLNTTSRHFDVLIAGKCEISSVTCQLGFNVMGSEKIPDFFTLNSSGKIIFAEPKVVCTIEKPLGEYEEDIFAIQLIRVSAEDDKFKDYICLGVREHGVVTEKLHIKNPCYCTNTKTMSKIELLPLISKKKVSEGYEEIEPGTELSATPIPFPTSGVFDFGAVYRIKIGNPIEWERHTTNLQEIKSGNGWYNVGRIGFGTINGEENQFVVINKDNGQLATSSDCITWKDGGNIYGDGKTAGLWETGLVYGNKTWCTVNRTTGEIMYLTDGADNWELSESKVTKDAFCLIFANEIFMIITDTRVVYSSKDAKKWDHIGNIPAGSGFIRILGYGGGKWLCGNITGDSMYISENGKQWTQINSNLNSFGGSFHGGDYANGYFYVISEQRGDIIRSYDGTIWTKVSIACNNGTHWNITSFGDKLYAVNTTGSCCHIGTLDPNDKVE